MAAHILCPKWTADEATPSRSGRRDSFSPGPELQAKASARLVWVAVICGVTTAAMFLLGLLVYPVDNPVLKSPILRLVNISLILISVTFIAIQRTGAFSTGSILKLGLAFQVVGGFLIAALEHFGPQMQAVNSIQYRGASWLTVWILVCGLLVPNRAWVSLTVSMLTAIMGVLAYALSIWSGHATPLRPSELALVMAPAFLMAGWATLLNRRFYHLEVSVSKAKDLGSYHLRSQIGKGGMGEVWCAEHSMLAREAAVKLIRPEVLEGQTGRQASVLRKRFEREARATASLSSPHTVALYDFGVAEDGSFYYVMELLKGIDLEKLVERYGPLPPARVANMLRQVCNSLEEAHRQGMVHRDIKPTNLFTCRLGIQYDFIKVLDFGLVRTEQTDGQSRMTMEGATTGTPAFMAPEMATASEEVDRRVDIYGLGCVAYFLLTGRLVFEEKSSLAMALAHLQKPPVPPSQCTELPIPPSLERVVMKCLEKKPEDRPQTALELAQMLEAAPDLAAWTAEDARHWWELNVPDSVCAEPVQHERSVDLTAVTRTA